MKNSIEYIGGIVGTALSSASWLADMENVVSMICAIIGLIITFITCVIIPIWKKIIKAKKDGIITPEEVEDIIKTTKNGLEKVKDKTKKGGK